MELQVNAMCRRAAAEETRGGSFTLSRVPRANNGASLPQSCRNELQLCFPRTKQNRSCCAIALSCLNSSWRKWRHCKQRLAKERFCSIRSVWQPPQFLVYVRHARALPRVLKAKKRRYLRKSFFGRSGKKWRCAPPFPLPQIPKRKYERSALALLHTKPIFCITRGSEKGQI